MMGFTPPNIILRFLILASLMLSLILLKINHPLSLAYSLLATSIIRGLMIFKLRLSWLFYTLILVFLGGVMVIIIYITSLAANEKIIYYNKFSNLIIMFLGGSLFITLEPLSCLKVSSRFKVVGLLYEKAGGGVLILAACALLICIFSVIKLIKFERGPLVKAY